jgi:hypothetical protein
MNMRSYTIDELDDLRDALSAKHPNAVSIEEIVRTHMVAGHTAQDINPRFPVRQVCIKCGASVRFLPAHMRTVHQQDKT